MSQVGALLLGLPGQFLSDTAYPAGGHNEEWQDEDGYEGQGPAQVEDHGQGCAQDYDVGHDADHSARHNVLYAGHVAVEPGDGLPGSHADEEAQVQALEMLVEMVPHIVHDTLAYQVAQVVLGHADEAGEDGG